MRLKAIGGGIQNRPLRKNFLLLQLLFQKAGQIDIEINFPLWGSLTISSGITVSAPEETTIGNIEGRDSFKTTELSRSEDFASSLPRNYFIFQFRLRSFPISLFSSPHPRVSVPAGRPISASGRTRQGLYGIFMTERVRLPGPIAPLVLRLPRSGNLMFLILQERRFLCHSFATRSDAR